MPDPVVYPPATPGEPGEPVASAAPAAPGNAVDERRAAADSRSTSPRAGRVRLDRLLPDLLRRGIDAGLDAVARGDEGVRGLVTDLRLPKEVASFVLGQMDTTKNAIVRAVAKEVRGFLRSSKFDEGARKLLTSIAIEVRTQIRFIPSETKGAEPKVESEVRVVRRRENS